MQMRQVSNAYLRKKITLLREIHGSPDQPGSCGLGARLCSQFYLPLHAGIVLHNKLGIGAVQVFFDKGKRAVRLVLFAPGSVEQVTGGDTGGVSPERAEAGRGNFS